MLYRGQKFSGSGYMMVETVLWSFNFAEVLNLIQHFLSLSLSLPCCTWGCQKIRAIVVTVRGKSGILAPVPQGEEQGSLTRKCPKPLRGHFKSLSSPSWACREMPPAGGARAGTGAAGQQKAMRLPGMPGHPSLCLAALLSCARASALPASPSGLCLAVSSAQPLLSVLLPGAGARWRLTSDQLAKPAGFASRATSTGFVL